MVTVVVILNLLLSLVCLFVAWQIWQWGEKLSRASDALTEAERTTYAILHQAPVNITSGQVNTAKLRVKYQLLCEQLEKIQQVLSLLGLFQNIWFRKGVKSTIKKLKKLILK